MSKPKLPSQMHPDYPKGWALKLANGLVCHYPAPTPWVSAFYREHSEFDNEGEYKFLCPYCGSEIGCEPTDECCGEVHGEWTYIENEEN